MPFIEKSKTSENRNDVHVYARPASKEKVSITEKKGKEDTQSLIDARVKLDATEDVTVSFDSLLVLPYILV